MPLLEITHLTKTYARPAAAASTGWSTWRRFPWRRATRWRCAARAARAKRPFSTSLPAFSRRIAARSCSTGATWRSSARRSGDRVRAGSIGYIFQTFNLLQGHTVLENVELGMAFGPGVNRARAVTLLQRVGLADRHGHYPRQLSTGQQQRVAVARALANQPKLVLADEPTGNLDRRNAREALALIREACREAGAALLLVSHDERVLAGFEHVQDFALLNLALTTTAP